MKTLRILAILGGTALAVQATQAVDSFIVSGYPTENESYAQASTGIALETSGYTGSSAETDLEARYRSSLESIGIKLNTYMATGFLLFLR